ncbi:MAG: 23S rRNA (uracil(1939)-C(5))-methyltransferase RlmD [Chlorobi bacterium]|nr:23S rRNA (uracil(1939)-C(5))-methyltransferase RlmD [Chlorobiota bacterium]
MARRKKPLPFIEKLEIVDVGAEGKAVGRYNERVVFVPFAATGDVADVQVFKKRKNYYEARIVHLHKKSEYRVEPECSHFGLCGGCKWQHIDYQYQLAFKQKQVRDALERIAKVPYPDVMPILGSDKPYYYRNKLEFTFSDRRWLTELDTSKEEGGPENTNGLGFHLPGMFDKILDIEHCYLQKDPSNDIRVEVKKYALEHGLSFYNVRSQEGFLRNLIIRTAVTGDLMVIVVFGHESNEIADVMDFVAERFPEITSLMYVVNEKKNDTISDLEIKLFKGKPFIMETMPSPVEGEPPFRFKVGPVSFYQTNPEQAFKLYKTAFEFAEFQGNELVYDLYTGTGTIAAFISRAVKRVIGVEYLEDAVRDARENMKLNAIDNVEFYSGDLAGLLDEEFFATQGKPDIIVTDPPRAGMHQKVVRQMLIAGPQKIIYVSCNPATQARDIALLNEKYEVKKVQPVDMFPQTHHVENVVLLGKR